jgi:hypothetical protein
MSQMLKAHEAAFNARENYRAKLAEAREAHKQVREAEDHVRHVRRLERERKQARGRGKAA